MKTYKTYQVFVSSTFGDLKEERRAVSTALLSINCIPIGLEMFPAVGDSLFDYNKKIIDSCDYFILIIGKKYGSISKEAQISFVEMEYEYAKSQNIPALTFIFEDGESSKNYESDKLENSKFESFKKSIIQKSLVRFFRSSDDLAASIVVSVSALIRDKSALGWAKDISHDTNTSLIKESEKSLNNELLDEFYKLNKKIDDLLFLQKAQEESLHPVNDKVRVFIGSSVEGLDVARSIQAELTYDYEIEIWNQGTVFGLGTSTLEALEQAVKSYDIGIFIFTPDDELISRGESKQVARDNVIFELGLFIGKLTRFRAFVIHPGGKGISIPSDLAGITTAPYDPHHPNLRAALGPACHAIRNAIRRITRSPVAG
ncbi:DUF4062 domain-containing protein [Fibrisoma montanum]|uniref:DUF4062 domain-containing protein n=1 Tax=Fibrisoma montanum TaxID=2305895 RepID=A0A418M6W7_9BACT|nr:TIR domain-containing protein [Fibrisoma montanum]RIV21612.1 DUF4062 domain-containing protein [Fibrisoma montanum]